MDVMKCLPSSDGLRQEFPSPWRDEELNLWSPTLPFPKGQWMELKLQPSNHLIFLVTSPILRLSGVPP